MAGKNDWDLPEVGGEFDLIDDIDILDNADFEFVDLEDKQEIINKTQKPEFESILENDPEIHEGEVIEPSTIVEEKIEKEETVLEEVAVEKDSDYYQPEREAAAKETEAEIGEEQTVERHSEEKSNKISMENEMLDKQVVFSDTTTDQMHLKEENIKKEEIKMVTKFKQEDLEKLLKSFLEISPDFEAAAIVSADGFVIASVLPDNIDENRLGAMSAAILSLGERAALELEKGKMETVFVEGEKGYVLLSSLTTEALLVVSTNKYAKLGLVFYELSALKKSLSAMFE